MKPRSEHQQRLETQLAEKDELIEALTGQLEMAVERLDRLRRIGADRPQTSTDPQAGLAGRELATRLTGVIEEWEELRPIDRLDRIEMGIAQLLEMVAERPLIDVAPPPPPPQPEIIETHSPAVTSYLPQESDVAPVVESFGSMLLDEAEGFTEPLDLPHPIQDLSDLDTVLAGVEVRDRYIQYLTARVRRAESKKTIPANWSELANAPDDYRRRLETLETMMRDHLRQAEIANALERADLTRERSKLQQLKQTLESQIRKLVPIETGEPNPPDKTDRAVKNDPDNRWKRLFSR